MSDSVAPARGAETPAPAHETVVEMRGVTKRFGSLAANEAVDLQLFRGEVHALLGENGAGKTTLMGLLFGLHRPDSGRIVINGQPVTFAGPRDAIAAGIGFVQQHYSLVPTLTVLENIVLSQRYGAGRKPSRASILARLSELAERYQLRVRPDAVVEELSVGKQQQVELVKALMGDPRLLILDEPAALLSGEEAAQLWQALRHLAASGVGIVLIGHHLEDVLRVADRVTVLRHGRTIATVPVAGTSAAELGTLMVGELREAAVAPAPRERATEVALAVAGLSVPADHGVHAVSFSVSRGEILGVAGVADSGQVELLEAIVGVRPASAGSIKVDGTEIAALPIRARHALGLAYIPPDRHRDGLVGPMSVADNLALGALDDAGVSRNGMLSLSGIEGRARRLMQRFDVRAAGPHVAAATLSGGNQQKIILARELGGGPRIILCCYPTRGLDFAATASVHAELRQAAEAGTAVVVVSTDLTELLALSHRIVVMQGGHLVGELPAAGASAERIGMMMGGGMTLGGGAGLGAGLGEDDQTNGPS